MPRRLAQDDEFRRFAERFVPTLVRTAYLLLGDFDAAVDAVQAAMFRVFRRWDRARVAPEAYSRTALVNVCKDRWRSQARRPENLVGDEALEALPVGSFTDVVDRRDAIVRALGQVSETQCEVLVLRYFLGLTIEETAEALEIPDGTVKSATSRGLTRLRDLLTLGEGAEAC